MKALVLAGGGARAAFQAGVLAQWAKQQDSSRDYQIICGSSAGALNASFLTAHCNDGFDVASHRLESFWINNVQKNSSVFKFWPCLIPMFWKGSIFSTAPLRRLVEKNVDVERLRSSKVKLSIGATCHETGELRFVGPESSNFIDWILASSAFPVAFPSIKIDGQHWCDGGIRSNVPIGQAIRLGATEIDVILPSNPWLVRTKRYEPGLLKLFSRVMNLMTDEMTRGDVESLGLKNDLSDVTERFRSVKVNLVMFNESHTVETLSFKTKNIKRAILAGHASADDVTTLE